MYDFSLPYSLREFFIYRISNRYLKFNELKIYHPTADILYDAQDLYLNVYKNAIEQEILTETEMTELLIECGEWDEYSENQLSEVLPKHVEYFLKEIFYKFDDEKHVRQIYTPLNLAREELNKLHQKKYHYNHLTAEGLASFAKFQYLIEHLTFDKGGKLAGDKYDIKDVMICWNNSYIDDITMRFLARNGPWRDIWSTSKQSASLFDVNGVNLSEEQRRLISWSKLYDDLQKCEDCPDDKIIDHDDALDGWLIHRKEQGEKNKRLQDAEKQNSHLKNAEEVFTVVPNKDKAKEIYDLNSPGSRAVIHGRLATVNKLGKATDTDFGDVQRKIQIIRNGGK